MTAAGADVSSIYLEFFSFSLLCTIEYTHTVLPNFHIVTGGSSSGARQHRCPIPLTVSVRQRRYVSNRNRVCRQGTPNKKSSKVQDTLVWGACTFDILWNNRDSF